jgi:hypothetical protein
LMGHTASFARRVMSQNHIPTLLAEGLPN